MRSRKSTEARFVEMQDLTPGSTYDDLITTPYECKMLDRDEWADCSDHAPIVATFEMNSSGVGHDDASG